jgi:hypothetical protein
MTVAKPTVKGPAPERIRPAEVKSYLFAGMTRLSRSSG